MKPQSPPPHAVMMQVLVGFWLSRAVHLAARLRLADAVGDRPVHLSELAERTATHPEALRRLMRALVAHGFFAERLDGCYVSTPLSDVLRSDREDSMRAVAEMILGHDHYEAWGNAEYSLRTGRVAFDAHFGKTVWEHYAENPEFERLFGEAMTNGSRMAGAAILSGYDFGRFAMAVDVGGGHGQFLRAILERNPDARGIVFDRPAVAAEAAERLRGEADRVSALGGDFFRSVPAGGDLYILKLILHDWDDDRAITILRNVRRAIAPDGRLAVIEAVLPQDAEPHPAKLADLNMMVMAGGRERTEAEYAQLLAAAGFHMRRVVDTPALQSVIEAVPVDR